MNNRQLKPYAELFEYHPENIYQKPLGSLMGFFEMKDYSKDSEYIVNFLTSVLKKEYYINSKRSAAESFDSALHKVNVALSEIAKHGNINWLGKIDAAICVLEQNTIHFSVTGNGHIFIKRQEQFMSISDGLAPDPSEPHPLKTFIDVSSGRIEDGDRILIFSDDIFQILPLEKLGRSVLRHDRTKFAQFMKTALSNELEMTCAIIVELFKKESPLTHGLAIVEEDALEEDYPIEEFNAFSEKTYAQKNPTKEIPSALKSSEEIEEKKEYTDRKTGHIYIQGDETQHLAPERTPMALIMAKEKFADISLQSKQEARRIFLSVKKKFSKTKNNPFEQEYSENMPNQENSDFQHISAKNELEQQETISQATPSDKSGHTPDNNPDHTNSSATELAITRPPKIKISTKESTEKKSSLPQGKLTLQEKISLAKQQVLDAQRQQKFPENSPETSSPNSQKHLRVKQEKPSYLLKTKLEAMDRPADNVRVEEKTSSSQNDFSIEPEDAYESRLSEGASRFLNPISISAGESFFAKAKVLTLPILEKMRQLLLGGANAYGKLSFKQKMVAVAIISSGVLAILFFQIQKPPKPSPQAIIEKPVPTLKESLSWEKSIIIDPSVQKTSLPTAGIAALTLENSPFIVTAQKVFSLQDATLKEYSIPSTEGAAIGATVMKDLGILLILTDQKKILSFSPVSQQFKSNSIAIPDNFHPKFMGTYLTYLYFPDTQSNKIYRFPRTSGGFGEKTDWLKDGQRLPNISSMTIDDSIYFSDRSGVFKYFKGEKQTMPLENSKTTVFFDLIYTSTDSSFIYVLDTKNYRLIRYTKNGEIVRQYFIGDQFKNITSFAIDSHDEKAYIISGNDLLSVALQ